MSSKLRHYIDLVNEAPLASYELLGDFNSPGSHHEKTRKLVSSPNYPVRMRKLMSLGYVDIAVNIGNVPAHVLNARDYADADNNSLMRYRNIENLTGTDPGNVNEVGEFTAEEIKNKYHLTVTINPDCINVLSLGNVNADHPLTPWMVIHRLTHMVEDSSDIGKYSTEKGRIDEETKSLWRAFMKTAVSCGLGRLKNLATMASARNGKLPELEIPNELFAQFLIKGKVTLKDDGGSVGNWSVKQAELKLNNVLFKLADSMIGKLYSGF